ncbi:MAG: major intrinsic protein [Gemmatimonadetes bacterium]|jgi:MIP family channel proteins|nr:major intrinsic protein [Gemmatimonadota bacterium]
MRDSWRHFAAEFIGIFALVFVGGASIMAAQLSHNTNGLVVAAIAHGVILAVMVTATMRISGHLNPAVTIGFLVTRRIEPTMAVIYIIAQLLGATVAAYALKAVFPPEIAVATRLGGQSVSIDLNATQAILCEAIATFFLVFVVFGTAVDPQAPKVGGFAIGLTIGADILAIGPLTGASMNPARSFGPAVVSGIFEGHLIYWIGPILGAIAAALLYDGLFLRRGKEPVDHGAVRPAA